MTWISGDAYEGTWKAGKQHGEGRMWAIREYYEGGFKNNVVHGKGMLRYPNGQVFNSKWKNGEFVR